MMFDKKNHEERLARLLAELADTVLQLSDQEIAAEVCANGADPEKEAECTRSMLRDCVKLFDSVNQRLWDLGHAIDPSHWHRGIDDFFSYCPGCGELVSFTIATGETRGYALRECCPKPNQHKVAQTATS